MSIITLFTDPHLGVNRASHTTRRSSYRLQQALFQQALRATEIDTNPKLCLGDLFDKATNEERIIAQGMRVASACKSTLSGNHDETNRESGMTSLEVLGEAGVPVCRAPDMSNPYFEVLDGTPSVYMVPHHASNAFFIEACQTAAAHAAKHRDGLASFLMIHCNYNFPMQLEDNTLNLPEEVAVSLLESFDLIFIGHEHNPSTHLDGRVIVMGNTHPTSFSDISDKFVYHLDTETAEVTKSCIWAMDKRYRELKLGEDPGSLVGVEFVNVIGNEGVANAAEVSDYINQVWRAGVAEDADQEENTLLAVRNNVKLRDSLDNVDTELETVQLEDLETTLRKDLTGSDLLPLFEELLAEARG